MWLIQDSWCFRATRSGLRPDRDMGLMNAIGLQPRHPAPSVTSQGTQTPIIQLQNAETQTERELPEPSGSQPAPSNGCPRHPATCWFGCRVLNEEHGISADAPPEAPSTSQAADHQAAGQQAAGQQAAGQQTVSQGSIQTEASGEDSAPSGGAGTAPPPTPRLWPP